MRKNKRGGQNKHWAERLRVLVWYHEIKRRSGWTDYMLSYEFAWRDEALHLRSSTNRSWTFEWIRKGGRQVQGRDWRWRNIDEIVTAVDQYSLVNFKGTEKLYRSDLWELIQHEIIAPESLQKRIEECLESNDLVRINPSNHPVISNLLYKYRIDEIFNACLVISLDSMDRLSRIVLLWNLYIQNEPAQNWRVRAILDETADDELDIFFYDALSLDDYRHYYPNVLETLQRSRLDLSEHHMKGYGFIEDIGTWPILPGNLIDPISDRLD